MLKKILISLVIVIAILASILIINTLTLKPSQSGIASVPPIEVPEIAIERFQKSIPFKTISYIERDRMDTAAFLGFQKYLEESYPIVEETMEKRLINYSILYKWAGTDPSAKAVVLTQVATFESKNTKIQPISGYYLS